MSNAESGIPNDRAREEFFESGASRSPPEWGTWRWTLIGSLDLMRSDPDAYSFPCLLCLQSHVPRIPFLYLVFRLLNIDMKQPQILVILRSPSLPPIPFHDRNHNPPPTVFLQSIHNLILLCKSHHFPDILDQLVGFLHLERLVHRPE